MNTDYKTLREALESAICYCAGGKSIIGANALCLRCKALAALDRIEKKKERKYILEELLEDITEENRHELIDRIEAVETVTVEELAINFAGDFEEISKAYPNGLRITKEK